MNLWMLPEANIQCSHAAMHCAALLPLYILRWESAYASNILSSAICVVSSLPFFTIVWHLCRFNVTEYYRSNGGA